MESSTLSNLDKIALPTAAPLGGIYFRDSGRMHRRAVLPPEGTGLFHVMSRTVGGSRLFADEEMLFEKGLEREAEAAWAYA